MSRKLSRAQARAMAAARKPEQRKGAARKQSYCWQMRRALRFRAPGAGTLLMGMRHVPLRCTCRRYLLTTTVSLFFRIDFGAKWIYYSIVRGTGVYCVCPMVVFGMRPNAGQP